MRARLVVFVMTVGLSIVVDAQQSPPSAQRDSVSNGVPALTLLFAHDAGCPSGATGSQAFEAAYAANTTELADDVTVPAADNWSVSRVFVRGRYATNSGPAPAVNVRFYEDATGKPDNTPIGVCDYSGITSFTDSAGVLTIDLPSACVLAGGAQGTRYWLSVQARMDYVPTGTWGWRDQAPSGSPAYWRNPGDGYATGCTAWTQRTTCVPYDLGNPDTCFALRGASTEIVYRDGFEGN